MDRDERREVEPSVVDPARSSRRRSGRRFREARRGSARRRSIAEALRPPRTQEGLAAPGKPRGSCRSVDRAPLRHRDAQDPPGRGEGRSAPPSTRETAAVISSSALRRGMQPAARIGRGRSVPSMERGRKDLRGSRQPRRPRRSIASAAVHGRVRDGVDRVARATDDRQPADRAEDQPARSVLGSIEQLPALAERIRSCFRVPREQLGAALLHRRSAPREDLRGPLAPS